jgi:hypothetical protein
MGVCWFDPQLACAASPQTRTSHSCKYTLLSCMLNSAGYMTSHWALGECHPPPPACNERLCMVERDYQFVVDCPANEFVRLKHIYILNEDPASIGTSVLKMHEQTVFGRVLLESLLHTSSQMLSYFAKFKDRNASLCQCQPFRNDLHDMLEACRVTCTCMHRYPDIS